jgi:hypothetical protein
LTPTIDKETKKGVVLSDGTVNVSTSVGAIRIFENDFK